MEVNHATSIEQTFNNENLFSNPPGLILVFDNYRGSTPERQQIAESTMAVRALLASYIYHSDLYSGRERPTLCCFAGEHQEGGESGSEKVKEWLTLCGVPEEKIITRQTTIITRTDITQLHSLAKEKQITSPLAIVTTNDHLTRTQQEVKSFCLSPGKTRFRLSYPTSLCIKSI